MATVYSFLAEVNWAFDLPPACRTKVKEQSLLISENSGYENSQITDEQIIGFPQTG
jgi:hypothetical protein